MTDDFTTLLETTNEDLKWQLLVGQESATDMLLDLYNLAPSDSIRRSITEAIKGLQGLTVVRTHALRLELNNLRSVHQTVLINRPVLQAS